MSLSGLGALGALMIAAALPLGAQRPVLELGLSYHEVNVSAVSPGYAGLSSNLWLWSRGPLSVTGEASASLRLPGDVGGPNCWNVPGGVCDQRVIGDIGRVGLTSRIGRRDGSGLYALASAGWWGTLRSGDVREGNRVIESASSERIGGMALGLGAGTSLPVGDRRTGIEARWMRFGGIRDGGIVQLALTRRW